MNKDISNTGSQRTVSNSGHFSDYEFVPGVIVETDDPLHYGRIKVTALGAFNANNSPVTHLPWCYPFMMMGNASYASYEKGSKVWVMRNKKRQDENWFIPMYELQSLPQQYVNENSKKKPEVISMRTNGGGNSSMTYDHGKGYNISTSGSGGGTGVNVGTNGKTTVNAGASAVKVENSGVTLGASSGDGEPAVLGNQLKNLINGILDALSEFCNILQKSDPYSQLGVIYLNTFINTLQTNGALDTILSKTVTINDGSNSSSSSDGSGDNKESNKSTTDKIKEMAANIKNALQQADTTQGQVKAANGTGTANYTGQALLDAQSAANRNNSGSVTNRNGVTQYYTGDAANDARNANLNLSPLTTLNQWSTTNNVPPANGTFVPPMYQKNKIW